MTEAYALVVWCVLLNVLSGILRQIKVHVRKARKCLFCFSQFFCTFGFEFLYKSFWQLCFTIKLSNKKKITWCF
jgi:hypothetical protein